jgi:hypothetical protein
MGDDNLIELIMNSLLGRLVDSSHVVRQMCIRGLGNVASIGKTQVIYISINNSLLGIVLNMVMMYIVMLFSLKTW